MTKEEIYKDIKETLGLVPGMFKIVPDESLELEWLLFKRVQLESGAVANKYRELIGLAVSALAKCKYCIFFHDAAARAAGATDAEIEDALHFAKSSTGWSTYISGHQLDFAQFQKEVRQICDYMVKKQRRKRT